jgi:hypothetical protein
MAGALSREPEGVAAANKGKRQRRDIVSGEVRDEQALIRFVAGPGGVIVADLARKLPGRGLWVASTRAAIDTAVRKGLFARAAKSAVTAPPDLADQVEALLHRRLLAGVGLARKAGDLALGFDKVLAALAAGRVAVLIEAADGAQDGRRKVLGAARRGPTSPSLVGLFTSAELGLALGGENVIHTALLAGRSADRWASEARRFSGFRPLFPEGWREESQDAGANWVSGDVSP